jgi:hypothetical protein
MTSVPAPVSAPAAAPTCINEEGAIALLNLSFELDALGAEVRAKAKIGARVAVIGRLGAALREHAATADRLLTEGNGDGLTPEQERICNAIDRLNRSERGHAALVRFRKLLEAGDGYAMGLDSGNWQALQDVVRACRIFGAHNVNGLLPRR